MKSIESGAGLNAVRSTIRPGTAADIAAIRDLLTLRDGRPWDDASTAWFVQGLDPRRCVAWLAFAGAKPVGLSTLFLRELRGPGGPRRAGYWANLFVHPDHRNEMLYPRLPMTIFKAAESLRLDLIYGATRQRGVAFGHTRIGFTTIGTLTLLAKPLRPARLIGKYKGWRPVSALAPALDPLWLAYLAARRAGAGDGARAEETDFKGPMADALIEMIQVDGNDRIRDTWTPESFHYRYRQTREGTRYFGLTVRRAGELVGGLVYRIADREPDIKTGVIMDVIVTPGHERAMVAAVAQAERHALREGCELMIFLSGLGPAVAKLFSAFGYRATPETYDLQVWPKTAIASSPALGEVSRWRFAFGDHDAF